MRNDEPQFEPVLESTQLREYTSPHLIPDASRVWTKEGPRSKRLHDEMEGRIDSWLKCGQFNGAGHKRRANSNASMNNI